MACRRGLSRASIKKLDVRRTHVKNPHVSNFAPSVSARSKAAAPVSIGAGFIALDWLLIGAERRRPNEVYAGGSCGNVMSILAYLGWQSYPVARLGLDSQANRLLADMQRWNVRTDYMLQEEHGVTPVIIVRLREKDDGTITRRYEWKHPSSGAWLPRYRPVPMKVANELLTRDLPVAKIFYFDRAEPSSLLLATYMRDQGSVVFFEPSATKNTQLFSECLAVSDIVKYSAERFPTAPANPMSPSPRLEIQTLGEKGLRYRLKLNSRVPGPWRHVPAYPVKELRDTTGCGDWCSAGLINKLCQNGREEFFRLNEEAIANGLRFGQALAAINCRYDGARGPMYNLSVDQVLAATARIVDE